MTLLEVMIAMGVAAVLMLAISDMTVNQEKSATNIQTSVSRSMLKMSFESWLTSSNGMSKTAADPLNAALAGCLSGPLCTATPPSGSGFYLDNALGAHVTGKSAAAPMYYDYTGSPCNAPSTTCIFETYSTYYATCAAGPTCPSPSSLTATFSINMVPGIKPIGGIPYAPFTSPPLPLNGASTGGPTSYGSTGQLGRDTGSCANAPPGGWVQMPGGNIGSGKVCFAFISYFEKTYRYNSAGCWYDKADGWIYGCTGDDTLVCDYICF